jgi:hypothetical protein
MMNGKEVKESRESLLRAGFTLVQIEHLSQFRRDYLEREARQALVGLRRLEFVRWLVAVGRLTE